jgi:prepilin peptidase CpaA
MTPLVPGVAGLLLLIVFTAAVYDIRFRRIPNWLTLTGILLGFALNIAVVYYDRPLQGVKHAAVGLGFAFAVYFIFYLIHAMGAGDVKLMAAVGAIVANPWNWFGIFLATALIGGAFALALLLARGRLRKTIWNVAFLLNELGHARAPFMSSEELDVKSPKSVKLPHGLTIAVGCLAFVVFGIVHK